MVPRAALAPKGLSSVRSPVAPELLCDAGMIRLPAMLAFAFLANTGACNPVEVAIDCHAICSRYQTCFDKSYDLSKCETSCRSNSTSDADYRHKAETCSACIDDRSCASATFGCGVPCATVVP